jgi:hypothetical protein
MTKVLLLVFGVVASNLFSQVIPDYSANRFGLYGEVEKMIEKSYKFDETQNCFITWKVETFFFNNGLLEKRVWEFLGDSPWTQIIFYSYNENGLIQKEEKNNVSWNQTTTKDYVYLDDKLHKIIEIGHSEGTTQFYYDMSEKISSSKKTNQNNKVLATDEYFDVADNENYTVKRILFSSKDGSVLTSNTYKYDNGLLIELTEEGKESGKSITNYNYNRANHRLNAMEGGSLSNIYDYEYGLSGNWLKARESSKSDFYLFRKIVYKTHDEGIANFDRSFYFTFPALNKHPISNIVAENSTYVFGKEMLSCTGDCLDGYGSYLFENGYVYTGFFKNGLRNGIGFQGITGGDDYYVGNWVNDKKEGYGNYRNGSIDYFGYFKNDQMDGEVAYVNYETGQGLGHAFSKGKVSDTYYLGDNQTNLGCISGDCINGFGNFVEPNGNMFVGFFENGAYKHGRYETPNGDLFLGEFADGKYNGFGSYFNINKDHYLGAYKDGAFHGIGCFYFYEDSTTKELIGEFENGQLVKSLK